jgi:hypothetical protein
MVSLIGVVIGLLQLELTRDTLKQNVLSIKWIRWGGDV